MTKTVRYFSKSGRTEKIARAIAKGAGTEAVSITDEPAPASPVDLLFLGGAPYANIMAPELKAYAAGLTKETVKKAVLFTTANWSRRTVLALKKTLQAKGIEVDERTFFAVAAAVDKKLDDAEAFGRQFAGEADE